MQSRRAQWAERVRQWRQSGLTAREFAERAGLNVGTLSHWAWRLGRTRRSDGRSARRRSGGDGLATTSWVEVVAGAIEDRRFELDLGDGRRLRIAAQFDRASLEQLLAVLAQSPR